jgi:SAM-dependent methyltransferase
LENNAKSPIHETGFKEPPFRGYSVKIQCRAEFIHISGLEMLIFFKVQENSEIKAVRQRALLSWGLLIGLACFPWTLVAAQAVRPYTCGFVLASQSAIQKVYGPELAILNLHPGDVIADVGGSNGYRMGMFAAICDSLEIFVQDIDTLCLNQQELEAVKSYYSQIRGKPLHSKFHLVVGNETHTHLPRGKMDKVLVTVAYHHFADPAAVLLDIAGALKPNGKIYLIENVVKRDGQRRPKLCDDPLLTEIGLKDAFRRQGFQVLEVHSLGRWWTKMFVLKPI